MGSMKSIIAVVLIVLGLVFGGIGGYLMFVMVPNNVDEATFPSDFDDHYTYGGDMLVLDTSTGSQSEIGFVVDRHIMVEEDLGGGKLKVHEVITGTDNATGEEVALLAKDNYYEVDDKTLQLYNVKVGADFEHTYTEEEDVNWVFPIPVEKEDLNVFSMNILTHSPAVYIGTKDIEGVECYEFYGEEIDKEVPLSPAMEAALPPGTVQKVTMWEKAWTHPTSGIIVDYQKHVTVRFEVPDFGEMPEIKYPSDFNSTTGFIGSAMMFDPATGALVDLGGITVEREIVTTMEDDGNLSVDDTTNVYDGAGNPVPALSSMVNVIFDAFTGEHADGVRSGQYMFPLTGVGEEDLMIWDDGFQMELTAEFDHVDNTSFAPLEANVYHIYVENGTYVSGGTTTLDMWYYIEPETGIVLDVKKEMTNWRAQDARRLPIDTSLINKTVHLNVSFTMADPISGSEEQYDLVLVQEINCTGFNLDYSEANFTEVVWMEFENGSYFKEPVTSTFWVDAVTMEYTTGRVGFFTFPVGIPVVDGNLTKMFLLYNGDVGMSMEANLVAEMEVGGLQAAVYRIEEEVPLPGYMAEAILGQPIPLPGATMLYTCNISYTVDTNTGTILDLVRDTAFQIVPPSYTYLMQNMNSTTVMEGMLGTDKMILTNTVMSEPNGETMADITVTSDVEFENGTPFSHDESTLTIDAMTHEVYVSGTPTGTYWLFCPMVNVSIEYPMAVKFAGATLMANAIFQSVDETTAVFSWYNTDLNGSLFDPMYENMTLNLTYMWDVDIPTGSVLDMSFDIALENETVDMPMITFEPTTDTLTGLGVKYQVTAWALYPEVAFPGGFEAVAMDSALFEDEATYAVMKANVLGRSLLVADGLIPAMWLSISFDEETKTAMATKATETKALYAQLPLLEAAIGAKRLFDAYPYVVVFYEQVDEGDGSIEYWAHHAQEVDDKIQLMGTTVPILLYVVMVAFILIALALLFIKPKEEEPDDESEDSSNLRGSVRSDEEEAMEDAEPSDEELDSLLDEDEEGPAPPEEGEEPELPEDEEEEPEEDEEPEEGEEEPEEGEEPPMEEPPMPEETEEIPGGMEPPMAP